MKEDSRQSPDEEGEDAAPRRAKPRGGAAAKGLSHNLNGQRLGRKGRDTRERILAATRELLDEARPGTPISLSAVARKASLGMTSLYVYFDDLTELLLAVLEPVMETGEEAYLAQLRARWPDETLAARCLQFVYSYYGFWSKNSRVLHLRNSMADQQDRRMMLHRVGSSQPVIGLIVEQMGRALDENAAAGMAMVLLTGIERVVTIATDESLKEVFGESFMPNVRNYLQAEARLLELGIREFRQAKEA